MLRMLINQIQAKGKVSEDIRSGKLKHALNIFFINVNRRLEREPSEKIVPYG